MISLRCSRTLRRDTLEQAQGKPPRLGQVIFCKGEDEDTLIADMVCRKDKPDAYDSDVHFGYLYSCFFASSPKRIAGKCFGGGICTRRKFQRMAMAEIDSGLKALY